MSLRAGDSVTVHARQDDGWWFGVVVDGARPRGGLFPGSYVEAVPKTPEDELPAAAAAAAMDAARSPARTDAALVDRRFPARAATPDQPVILEPLAETLVPGGTTRETAPGRAGLRGAFASPSETEEDVVNGEEQRALRDIEDLEARAGAAERDLLEERAAAAAFRDATTNSLRVLEDTLARALAPLGGVVLAPPDGGDGFWDAAAPSSDGDDVASDLARELRDKARPGALGRRTLAWGDLCEAVSTIVPLRRRNLSFGWRRSPFGNVLSLRARHRRLLAGPAALVADVDAREPGIRVAGLAVAESVTRGPAESDAAFSIADEGARGPAARRRRVYHGAGSGASPRPV